jgi:hypothetical protein
MDENMVLLGIKRERGAELDKVFDAMKDRDLMQPDPNEALVKSGYKL